MNLFESKEVWPPEVLTGFLESLSEVELPLTPFV